MDSLQRVLTRYILRQHLCLTSVISRDFLHPQTLRLQARRPRSSSLLHASAHTTALWVSSHHLSTQSPPPPPGPPSLAPSSSILASLLGRATAGEGEEGQGVVRAKARRAAAATVEEAVADTSRRTTPQEQATAPHLSNTTTNGSNGDYVPLLFRKDFMQSWRHPHAPLPLERLTAFASYTSAPPLASAHAPPPPPPPPPPPSSSVSLGKALASLPDVPEAVDEYVLEQTAGNDSGAVDDLLEEAATASEDVNVTTGEEAAATYTLTRIPVTTSKVILDPVQWLSQGPDAPLMDTGALLSSIAPGAWELTFTESVYRAGEPGYSVNDGYSSNTDASVAEEEEAGGSAAAATVTSEGEGSNGLAEQRDEGKELNSQPSTAALGTVTIVEMGEEGEDGEEERGTQETADTVTAGDAAVDNFYLSKDGAHHDKSLPHLFSPKKGAGAAASERLVYNVFTRRVVREHSPVVQSLALLGIYVDGATRQLALKDPDALHAFAKKLRNNEVTWPSAWSHAILYRQLEHFLLDERITDPAVRIEELLAVQYKRWQGLHKVGVVASSSAEPHTSAGVDGGEAALPTDALVQRVGQFFSLSDLNEEQQKVVELVLQGHHTYIGGPAGTGKSVLLQVIKRQLQQEGLMVAVTGTTGVAATLIGGTTLHHRFRVNILGEFMRLQELAEYDVIIIDEVSMLSRDLFESLERQLRHVNGVDLPFGGIQIILCGDFLQLGAIAAQPIVNSPVFRRNFVMLKLTTVVRQAASPLFSRQLQQLRRGCVPQGLSETINFIKTPDAGLTETERRLKAQQREQLRGILGDSGVAAAAAGATGSEKEKVQEDGAQVPEENALVEGAVNLLPTNVEVHAANERELAKLPGDLNVFAAEVLPPGLLGNWSPTYLLRIHDARLVKSRRLAAEIELFIRGYFKGTEAAQAWMQDGASHRHVVLYPLFADALALRVRLPPRFPSEEVNKFIAHMNTNLDSFLTGLGLGVRVREVLPCSEGLQTESDEFILQQYAAASPLSKSLALKIGARVMLRTNLLPGLVNGSLGTVVGFRRLVVDEINGYSAKMAEVVTAYMDFLMYEQGFQTPMAPVVDFGFGRIHLIPPTVFHVGGLANTHYHSVGIVALPLSLAYAFTVHKVQGLTLVGRVHLELSRMWPCEHLLYVAMSRVRNPEQLSIAGFHESLVKAAPDCLAFDDALPSVEGARVLPHFVPATWRRAPQRRKRLLRAQSLTKLAKQRAERRRQRLDAEVQALQASLLEETIQASPPV